MSLESKSGKRRGKSADRAELVLPCGFASETSERITLVAAVFQSVASYSLAPWGLTSTVLFCRRVKKPGHRAIDCEFASVMVKMPEPRRLVQAIARRKSMPGRTQEIVRLAVSEKDLVVWMASAETRGQFFRHLFL